jgi:lysylphosphatidylglycerol synthetase-like protein (DUF2156 family)
VRSADTSPIVEPGPAPAEAGASRQGEQDSCSGRHGWHGWLGWQHLSSGAGRRAFRNPSRRRARRTTGALVATVGEDQRSTATALLQEEGTGNNLAWLTTWPENRWFTTPRCSGYVAYRIHAGVALRLCDPVAARVEDRSELLAAFSDKAHHDGLVPCLFSVTQEGATHALTRGWHALEVAEEAVIDLPSLEFRGKAWQDVRTALNQGSKLGITHRLAPLIEQPRGIQVQVRAISSEWVEDKGMPEMGFTLGGVDEALDPEVRVGLAIDADSTVHGVTSWMPVHASGGGEPVGWTLDVMRKLPGGFRYSLEFLISSACLAFKEEGCRLVSLSGAPWQRPGSRTPRWTATRSTTSWSDSAPDSSRTTGSGRCTRSKPSSSRDSSPCSSCSRMRPLSPASAWP